MRWLPLLLLTACGGGWTESDTASAKAAAMAEGFLLATCGDDGGACDRAVVRAMERGAFCDNVSMLSRRGIKVELRGVKCQPQ